METIRALIQGLDGLAFLKDNAAKLKGKYGMNIRASQADEQAYEAMPSSAERVFVFSLFSSNTAKGAGGAMI
jgi:hypothetical protein